MRQWRTPNGGDHVAKPCDQSHSRRHRIPGPVSIAETSCTGLPSAKGIRNDVVSRLPSLQRLRGEGAAR
jgi:hypothetical protein